MIAKNIIAKVEKKKKEEYPGRKYYYYHPQNGPEIIDFYGNGKFGRKEIQNDKEVYTNWFKVLVNQKIDYSLSKPVTVDKNIPKQFNIEDILDKLTLSASMDSKAWLHLIINDSGDLDWITIDDSQIIPEYDRYNKYITSIIYFWETKTTEAQLREGQPEDETKITHVQIWTPVQLIEFEYKIDSSGKVKIIKDITAKNHYLEVLKYQDKEEEINPKSFGFVPFIPLINNKNCESDIENIKDLLDIYNEICTGFINNVRKFQEMLMKLKGYGGQDLEEFEKQLKEHRVIPVDENGDFDYLKVEIPVEARKTLLDIVKKNIFILGRGVDPESDFGGGNVTNVVIKSKYANLDMKNSDMEKQIRLFYRQVITMINLYYSLDIDSEITFNRSQIFNEGEIIDNCMKSMGIVSRKTILEKHPFVSDLSIELDRLKEEEEEEEEINVPEIHMKR
jgi:SPP1 family phage portal protein